MEIQATSDGNDQASPVRHDNGKITTSDDLGLFWQSWQQNQPVGVIVLIHGLAEHSSRYASTAEHFARQGWAIYACDLRGHGWSSDGHQSELQPCPRKSERKFQVKMDGAQADDLYAEWQLAVTRIRSSI